MPTCTRADALFALLSEQAGGSLLFDYAVCAFAAPAFVCCDTFCTLFVERCAALPASQRLLLLHLLQRVAPQLSHISLATPQLAGTLPTRDKRLNRLQLRYTLRHETLVRLLHCLHALATQPPTDVDAEKQVLRKRSVDDIDSSSSLSSSSSDGAAARAVLFTLANDRRFVQLLEAGAPQLDGNVARKVVCEILVEFIINYIHT